MRHGLGTGELVSLSILAVLVIGGSRSATAQMPDPPSWPSPPHQILLVGTFHFRDAGLDSYRPQFDIDILSPTRQREVQELVDRLATYQPTKIAVEVMLTDQKWLDSVYTGYRTTAFPVGSDEIFQLGFRLAQLVGHDRLFAVDAERRFYEPWVDPDEYAARHAQQHLLDPAWEARYGRLYRYEDEIKVHRTLRSHLLYLNTPEWALRSHGRYLIDNFEIGDDTTYPGVDSRTAWFNRNLRIFANLQRLVESEHERIVLIVGAGHLALLRHAVLASPQFELVELAHVLGSN